MIVKNCAEILVRFRVLSQKVEKYRRALAIFERMLVMDHSNTLTDLKNILIIQQLRTSHSIWIRWLGKFFSEVREFLKS